MSRLRRRLRRAALQLRPARGINDRAAAHGPIAALHVASVGHGYCPPRWRPGWSPVWHPAFAPRASAASDSALVSGRRQPPGNANLPGDSRPPLAIEKAASWLLDKEVTRRGDWAEHADAPPAGWFFEYHNEFYPDVDDTAMVMI